MTEHAHHIANTLAPHFETTCGYCNAQLEITAGPVTGPRLRRAYICPECGKQYNVTSAGALHVRVIQRRNDGKSDGYQETMF